MTLIQNRSLISRHWVIISLVSIALLVRVVYFFEIMQGPCYHQYLWEQSDMNFFHTWAQKIAGGDILVNDPLHPYHGWHDRVAEAYLRDYGDKDPTVYTKVTSGNVDLETKRQLWNRWYGEKRYHQEPLYPYTIAMLYSIFGMQVLWVYLFQLLIGIGSIFLIYDITLRLFNPQVAAVAGILAVLCGPLLFYETVLLRATLITFFGLLIVWLTIKALGRNSLISWGKIGFSLGLAVLLKSTFLLFLAGLVGYLTFFSGHSKKRVFAILSVLVVGMVIVLTPLLARNIAVGASPTGLSSVTAVTFLSANSHDSYPRGFFVSDYVAPVMAKTNGRVVPTFIETLKTQSFVNYTMLMWDKFSLLWHWYEIPNNANFYYYRLHAQILQWLPVTFLILAPLSIVGIGLAFYERRQCVPLYLLLTMHVVSILLVYVASRFRTPLIAALIPFAAFSIYRLIEGVKKRKSQTILLLSVALVLISFWTMRPLPKTVPLVRTADCGAPYEFYYRPRLSAAKSENNLDQRLKLYEDFLNSEPRSIRKLRSDATPQNQSDRNTAFLFSRFRRMYAKALLQAKQKEQAQVVLKRAGELEKLSSM